MKVILIRHAAAVSKGTPGVLDAERPLTSRGKVKFRSAARGLARIVRQPNVLLTSPLPRAQETMLDSGHAEHLAFKNGGAAVVDLPDGPSTPGRLIRFLDPRVLRTLANGSAKA